MRQDDSCLELERTSVPLTNKEVSRSWFLGKFNFRNLKFEVLPGYPNLNLLLPKLTGNSVPLPESPVVNQSPTLLFPLGSRPSSPGFFKSFLHRQCQVFSVHSWTKTLENLQDV